MLASANATSPTMRAVPVESVARLMPTSMTIAPGLIQSPRTSPGQPAAAMTMSTFRQRTRQVSRLELSTCHRTSGIAAHKCQRFSNDIRATDDDDIKPVQVTHDRLDEMDNPKRSARGECWSTRRQSSCIIRMEAIHVLGWIDGLQYAPTVDLPRQRKLNEDAINGIVSVKLLD